MKKLVAGVVGSILMAGAMMAAPALGQTERKTDIVDLGGKSVDSLLLRYGFDATWAIDTQNILLRDTYRDYYKVTLKAPCPKLEMDRGIRFFPALSGRVYSHLRYEVRDPASQPCDIGRIEKIEQDAALALRATLVKG